MRERLKKHWQFIELEITQIAYNDGNIVSSRPENIFEYEKEISKDKEFKQEKIKLMELFYMMKSSATYRLQYL